LQIRFEETLSRELFNWTDHGYLVFQSPARPISFFTIAEIGALE